MNKYIATNDITTMKKLLSLLGITALYATATLAAPLGVGFTYQGRLNDGGAPANGAYDLTFTLYADPTDNLYFGEHITLSAVPVTNGIFTVELNTAGEFGPYAFNGEARWLQIGVRTNCNCIATWTFLTPRQPLRPVPYALMAGTVPDGAITSGKIANGAVGPQQIAVGGIAMSNLAAGSITSDKLAAGAVTGDKLAAGAAAANLLSGGHAPVGGGGVILSEQSNATNLLNAGYIKIGQVNLVEEAWQRKADATAGTSKRAEHTAVWTGTELIIWGGNFNNTLLDTGARYNPTTDSLTPISTVNAPAARFRHSAVWTGTQMIVWGGLNSIGTAPDALNTGGRYDPSTDTWLPTSTTGAPSGRASHTAVWSGSEMLVWGGGYVVYQGEYDNQGDGAKYNPLTDTWTPIAINNAPDARGFQTAIWTGNRMIIWGGHQNFWKSSSWGPYIDRSTNFSTGASYNPTANTWSLISASGAPSARVRPLAIWSGSEMIIWGGGDETGPLNSGGRYNPTANTWTSIATAGAPSPRYSCSLVWTGSRMIVWGGDAGGATYLNDGFSYNPAANTWTPINGLNGPTPRTSHTSVWTGTRMVVWGGSDGWAGIIPTFPEFGGRYDPVTDSWTSTSAPADASERSEHSAIWSGSEMIVWGGNGGGFLVNNGLRYNPATDAWSPVAGSGAPSARATHTAVWSGSEMLIWGGRSASTTLGTGARYNPAANTWSEITTNGAPVPRHDHTAVWAGGEMIVWGGHSAFNAGPLGDGARYNPANNTWVALNSNGAPAARGHHSAVWTGDEMIVWGGYTLWPAFGDGARYSPTSNTWTPMPSANAPSPRGSHSAIWTGTEMILWGGVTQGSYLNSGARFNPATSTWTALPLTNAPAPRCFHTAVWAGTQMIVWGGINSTNLGGSYFGACYLVSENKWSPTTLAGCAPYRRDHSAVWDGTQMLIWGGDQGGKMRKDTYAYTPARSMYLYMKP